MSLPKAYEPKNIEAKRYHFWKQNKLFAPIEDSQAPKYSIVIPPPNVTGVLHMGHALVNTLQDILIRWKRMQGFRTVWLPGTDHAGIATQTVVERHLIATTGKRRTDFDRETFLQHVWQILQVWRIASNLEHSSSILSLSFWPFSSSSTLEFFKNIQRFPSDL